jgi:hypothetical protein
MNPFKALASRLRLKLGRISFDEMGSALKFANSKDLSLFYMGFGTHSAPAINA